MGKILVVTSSDEPNVRKVLDFLPPERVFRLDTDVLLDHRFFHQLGGQVSAWSFMRDGRTISGDEVDAVWYRRPANPKASAELSEKYRLFAENESQKFLRALWSTVPREGVLWVNHPSVLRELEFNKPYQCQIAKRVGLSIPETVITNDSQVAEDFFERCGGEVIIKIFGGHPLQDEAGHSVSIFTNRLARETLQAFRRELSYAPVMLQSYVPKRIELRITAVGDELFACAIHSQDSERTKDDWRRYDFEKVKHEVYRLPAEIEDKLRRYLREIGIVFGAIDMVVTPDGEHVFLEVNPSGQWGWIESLTGMPISRAIAEILANSAQTP